FLPPVPNLFLFFFQAEDGIRDDLVTGVQTCALPIYFVNAGHNPPLVLPARPALPSEWWVNPGATRFLESTGVPLGLFPEVAHEVKTEALSPGTLVVLYSDGITEARDSSGNFYGVKRLVGLVSRERQKPAEELVD